MKNNHQFRLRPRRAWTIWLICIFGAILTALPFVYGVSGNARTIDMVAGVGVIVASGLFLLSPTWRSYVAIDAEGLRVQGPRGTRLLIRWAEVEEIVIDQEEQAALIRGPQGSRSFLLPSSGHPAPYQIEHPDLLYQQIISIAPSEKIRHSRTLS